MLLDIIEYALSLLSAGMKLVLLAAVISLPLSLMRLSMAVVDEKTAPPAPDNQSWAKRIIHFWINATHDLSVVMIRIMLSMFINRTALIGFTIFIGAQALAIADPSKSSECAAVIAMSLLWVTCDAILRGISLGAEMFKPEDDKPFHTQMIGQVVALVQTYAAIGKRIVLRLKAA